MRGLATDNRAVLLWNVKQASEATGIPVNTLYGWVSRKRIPYVKVNGKLMFDPGDIRIWLDDQKVQPANAG